jgi:hypothetical protein
LQYHNTPLENEQTVSSYNITTESILDLLPTLSIIVKTPLGKKIVLEVSPNDLIHSIKKQILSG